MVKKLQEYFNRFNLHNVLGGALRVLILRISGVIFLFGITLYLTNFYSAEVVGAYEFTRSSLFLIGGITLLGTDQSILFFSGRFSKPEQAGTLFQVYLKMLGLLLGVSIVLLGIILVIPKEYYNLFFNDQRSGNLLIKMGFCLFFYAVTLFNTEFFRAFDLHEKSELYRGILKQLPFGFGLLILFLFNKHDYVVEVFLLSFLFCALLSGLEVYLKYKRLNPVVSRQTSIRFKTVLKATIPIAISAFGFYMLISIDVFFLKRYTNFETLAYYGTSIKIIFLISTLINVMGSYLSVRIADLFVTDQVALQAVLKKGVRVIVGLALGLSVILFVFAAEILGVFGAAYQEAVPALRILIAGHFMSTLFGVTQVYLNMTKKQVVLQYILIIAVVINAILNAILIPKYGMLGAAVASAFSVIFWNGCAVVWVYKKDHIKLFLH
ncbi:MAG: polysaccharide biosynthesis C-terminal domain-containing protein [Bacteroidota bacterium]|nr:polysaccharide biosynthesis C-terminal domain-containing protein [Bacteroidota bacterium]